MKFIEIGDYGRQDVKEVPVKQKNLVYGLEGIKTLFGCSTTTAWRIKRLPYLSRGEESSKSDAWME